MVKKIKRIWVETFDKISRRKEKSRKIKHRKYIQEVHKALREFEIAKYYYEKAKEPHKKELYRRKFVKAKVEYIIILKRFNRFCGVC